MGVEIEDAVNTAAAVAVVAVAASGGGSTKFGILVPKI